MRYTLLAELRERGKIRLRLRRRVDLANSSKSTVDRAAPMTNHVEALALASGIRQKARVGLLTPRLGQRAFSSWRNRSNNGSIWLMANHAACHHRVTAAGPYRSRTGFPDFPFRSALCLGTGITSYLRGLFDSDRSGLVGQPGISMTNAPEHTDESFVPAVPSNSKFMLGDRFKTLREHVAVLSRSGLVEAFIRKGIEGRSVLRLGFHIVSHQVSHKDWRRSIGIPSNRSKNSDRKRPSSLGISSS